MLVLARKINESILIGDNIKVQILEIKGDQVKLGIVAPREIRVLRPEVLDEIKKSTLSSAKIAKSEVEQILQAFKASPKPDCGQNEGS